MIEVERILLPTTYLEFVDVKGKLNKLYNLSLLYKDYCVEDASSQSKPWQLLSYEAVKALYGLVTTASKASTAKDLAIRVSTIKASAAFGVRATLADSRACSPTLKIYLVLAEKQKEQREAKILCSTKKFHSWTPLLV